MKIKKQRTPFMRCHLNLPRRACNRRRYKFIGLRRTTAESMSQCHYASASIWSAGTTAGTTSPKSEMEATLVRRLRLERVICVVRDNLLL